MTYTNVRKRYSRRATLEEQLLEGANCSTLRIGLPRITLRPRLPQVGFFYRELLLHGKHFQDPVSFDSFGGVASGAIPLAREGERCFDELHAFGKFFVKPIIPSGINIGKSEARLPSVGPPTQPLATISEAETDRLVSEQVEVSEDLAPSEPQSLLADVPSASSSSSPSSSLSELDPLLPPFPPSQSSSKPSLPSRPSSRTRLISHSPTTDSASSSSSNSSSTPVGDPCIRDQPYLPPSTPSSLPPSYSSPSFSSSSPPCYTKALETALDLGQLRVLQRETHLL